MKIGDPWNESRCFLDPVTGRRIRKLSTQGLLNQTPTYHTNSGFTADSRFLVFVSVRGHETWVIRAEVDTGELQLLWKTTGVEDRNYIHRGMSLKIPEVDGHGICGNRVCLAPQSGLAVFTVDRRMMCVDIHTGAVRTLFDDCGDEWIFGAPCVSPDERSAAIALSSSHPEMRRGKWSLKPEKKYIEYPHQLKLLQIPLTVPGPLEMIYQHPSPAQSAHCAYCPADPNILYFDLDLPPHYWEGSDGKTPRIWLLNIKEKNIRPLLESYPGAFQIHQAWLWDGSGMIYHGHASAGGEYFGVAGLDGRKIYERVFPKAAFYGHNSPDPRAPAMIIDGFFSNDLLQWLYYDDNQNEEPKLEPICRHGTEWESIPGQYSHPHPLASPDGRWISYTTAYDGRTDVQVVEIIR